MWVQLEAKEKGFAVSTEEFDENVRWAKQRIIERADLPRDTRPGWSMVNTPAIHLAIMAHAVPDPSVVSAESPPHQETPASSSGGEWSLDVVASAAKEHPATVL